VLEKVHATIKIRDEEVTWLNGELAQLSVSYEDQRQAGEEKDDVILNLQWAVETTRAAPETEKKQVEGELFFPLFICWPNSLRDLLPAKFVLLFSGLRMALGTSTTQVQAIQAAYNSSHQELEELHAAALEACQGVEEGEAQAGSSMASRLRTLGRHITQRMRCALHLGVQKALGMVVSHYRVNLRAISTGYVVTTGVDDEVEMNCVDTLAAPAANVLTEDFMDFLFPDAPPAGGPEA
jgi:hypothetical protein